jgi:hypothetical protein
MTIVEPKGMLVIRTRLTETDENIFLNKKTQAQTF